MSVPSAPQIRIRPRPYDTAIRIRWNPPVDDGGSAITSYLLTGTDISPTTLDVAAREYLITGLTASQAYTFELAAVNAIGTGSTATYRTVTTGLRPSAPQNVAVTAAGGDAITVTWDPATSDGGAPIGWYYVEAQSSNPSDRRIRESAEFWYTSRTFGGLNTDSTYTIRMNAINDPGYGPAVFSDPFIFGGQWTMRNTPGSYNWQYVLVAQAAPNYIVAIPNDTSYLQTSSDSGTTWVQRTDLEPQNWLYTSVSANGATIILGNGDSPSMYISTDYGATWTTYTFATNAFQGSAISDNGTVIYAIDGNGLQKSVNSGSTWASINTDTYPSVVACSSTGTTVAYVNGSTQVVYISTNGGASFTNSLTLTGVTALKMSADGSVIAAMDMGGGGDGICYITNDAGVTWIDTSAASPNTFTSRMEVSRSTGYVFTIDGSSSNKIYCTTDYGTNWSTVAGSETYPSMTSIAVDASGATVYSTASLSSTIYIIKGSRTDSELLPIDIIPGNDTWGPYQYTPDLTTIYALRMGGYPKLYKSTDSGVSWTGITTPAAQGKYGTNMNGITASSDATIVYIVNGSYPDALMYKSINGGSTWSELTAVTAAGTGFINIATCSADGSIVIYSRSGEYIYRSSDGGATVTAITAAGTGYWGQPILTPDGSTAYIIEYGTDTVYKSVDSGVSWSPLSNTIGNGNNTLSCSADGTKFVLTSYTNNTYYVSTNSGTTLNSYSTPDSNKWNIVTNSDFSKLQGVPITTTSFYYTSTDAGATFTSHSFPYTGIDSYVLNTDTNGTKLILGVTSSRIVMYV